MRFNSVQTWKQMKIAPVLIYHRLILVRFLWDDSVKLRLLICFIDKREAIQKRTFTKWVNHHLINVFLKFFCCPNHFLILAWGSRSVRRLPRRYQTTKAGRNFSRSKTGCRTWGFTISSNSKCPKMSWYAEGRTNQTGQHSGWRHSGRES